MYDFDEIISREKTNCYKYDLRKKFFNKEDILPMWVADMDIKTPAFIIDALKDRLSHEVLGYTYIPDSFYEANIKWLHKKHNWLVKKDWISFAPGVVPSLNLIVLAFSNPGDKIIIQRPVYFPFSTVITNHDRILVNNPLKLINNKYEIDFEDLVSKIDKNVRLFILCNPHNPTGNVWKKDELEKIADLCLKNNIILVSDEIHSDIIYSGHQHIPVASLSEEISDNVITLLSPSKTFNIAGLSTSVVISSNKKIIKNYNKILDKIHVGNGNIFGFVALEAAYNHGEDWLNQWLLYLEQTRDYIIQFITKNAPGIIPVVPEATYLIWLDFRNFNLPQKKLTKKLIDEAKLGLSNGIIFGQEGEGFQRLNFGCSKKLVEIALNRLQSCFSLY